MSSRTKTTNPWVVLVVLCCGFFMILLDTTVVQIAIPNMLDGLHTTLDQILWVVNAYILVYAVLLITAGRMGDVYGQRNLFALGLVIFTAGSAYCGLSPDTTHLVLARVIQGVGGALLTPQTLAILTTLFPADKRGAAFGIWGGIAGIAAIAGPTLGGFLVTNFSWRWIFFINVPIGIATLIATFLLIPDMRVGQSHRFDVGGVVLASLGLFGIVFGLVEGQRFNWGSIIGPVSVPLILGLGVLMMVVFVWWEGRQDEPIAPLSLFKDRNFSLMNWVGLAVSFGMLGFFLPVVIYFQSVLGLSALQTGLAILPMSGLTMIIAPFAGRLADRYGGKYFLFGGNLLFAIGMAWLALTVSSTAGEWSFLPCFLLTGFGLGMVFAPMATIAMRNIKADMAGAASGVFNTTRQLGSVIGTAVVGAILQNQLATDLVAQAQTASQQLPQQFRAQFLQGFAQAAQGGLQVGPGQDVAGQLPPGIPAAVAQQLVQIVHQVFTAAFVDAIRPTLAVPVCLMFIGALSALAIRRRTKGDAPEEREDEDVRPEVMAVAG